MQKRVRVRRERPSALSWALALAVTMLAVYLVTLSAPDTEAAEETAAAGVRVTREITLPGVSFFFADLGTHPDAAQARIAAASLANRGAAGVVCEQPDGFHVLGAGYALRTDAERIARQLADREALASGVLEQSAPGVSLRITAPEKDADAIANADAVLREQLNHIASMALQIDRGELTSAAARTLAQVSRSELRRAEKALRDVDGAEEQPVCAGLLGQLEALSEMLDETARSGAAGAKLSGQLRCCHVTGTIRLTEYLNGLNR